MKRALAAALAAVLAALLGLAWALRPGEKRRVEIPPGLSASRTADLLAREGVVPSARAFRVFLKVTGFDRTLKPGVYTLRVNEPIGPLTRKLTLGLVDGVRVTVPEGFRASQIAERLEAAGVAKAEPFLALVASRRLEGRLFPSTYLFPLAAGHERAAELMLAEFDRQIGAAWAAAASKPALSFEEALTVASIVEREAVLKQERPIIAAVYLNRVKKKMPLQADPTVQYALGHWKKGLTYADLKIASPYNTYARRGLPPGPICSPGLESFKAVLDPARTSALYFVADTKGGHLFSETNEQHAEARALYKKELRRIKQRLREEEKKKAAASR